MPLPKTITITEARNNIFELAKQAQRPGAYFTLTENGRPKIVIMSANEFESWAETLEVIKDFPNLKKDIAEAESDLKKGLCITLDEYLINEGLVVANTGKKKYGVHSGVAKKNTKRYRKN